MALGFGSQGTGSTDRVDSAYASYPTLISFHAFIRKDGNGGGNSGKIFDMNTSIFKLQYAATGGGLNLSAGSGNVGWAISNGYLGTSLKPFGFSLDTGSTSNDPVVYMSGTPSSPTRLATPSYGAAGVWTFGNRGDGARNWDGQLAEVAIWDVILTDDEFAALAKGVSPALIRPQSLKEYLPFVRSPQSRILGAVTVGGTPLAQPHPPVLYPRARGKIIPFKAASGSVIDEAVAAVEVDRVTPATPATVLLGVAALADRAQTASQGANVLAGALAAADKVSITGAAGGVFGGAASDGDASAGLPFGANVLAGALGAADAAQVTGAGDSLKLLPPIAAEDVSQIGAAASVVAAGHLTGADADQTVGAAALAESAGTQMVETEAGLPFALVVVGTTVTALDAAQALALALLVAAGVAQAGDVDQISGGGQVRSIYVIDPLRRILRVRADARGVRVRHLPRTLPVVADRRTLGVKKETA